MAVNIAVYIPLGMSAYLAMRRFKSRALEILVPLPSGHYCPPPSKWYSCSRRIAYAAQWILSTTSWVQGSGVLAGFAFTQIADVPVTGPVFHVRDRSAVALLFCWVSSLLFPLFPVLFAGYRRAKVSAFIDAPLISPIPILLSAAEWFAAGRLLVYGGSQVAIPVVVRTAFAGAGPVRDRQSQSDAGGLRSEQPGGPAVPFLRQGAERRPPRRYRASASALTLRGLAPFHFEGPPRVFCGFRSEDFWLPSGRNAIPILLGKLFQYGASIWLCLASGWAAACNCHRDRGFGWNRGAADSDIPGHVAEINDPLLAVLLCLGLRALCKLPGSSMADERC